ncbi:MAG: hypothetical protein JAZ11_13920 [Candidatus Thiodiazotropha lotti]|nr:hypothetical protein [Candidatus Thiodiazotropha lotti]
MPNTKSFDNIKSIDDIYEFESYLGSKTGFDNPFAEINPPLHYQAGVTEGAKSSISSSIGTKTPPTAWEWEATGARPKTPEIDKGTPAYLRRKVQNQFSLNVRKFPETTKSQVNYIKALRETVYDTSAYKVTENYASAVENSSINLKLNTFLKEESGQQLFERSLRELKKHPVPGALKSKFLKLKDKFAFNKALKLKLEDLKIAHQEEIDLLKEFYGKEPSIQKERLNAVKNKIKSAKHQAFPDTNNITDGVANRMKYQLSKHQEQHDIEEDLINAEAHFAKKLKQLELNHKQEVAYVKKLHRTYLQQGHRVTDWRKKFIGRETENVKASAKAGLRELNEPNRTLISDLKKVRIPKIPRVRFPKIPDAAKMRLKSVWNLFKL